MSTTQQPEYNLYDFRSPNRIPAEQKRTVTLIHETYAQTVAITLSSFLRTEVHVTLKDVEQQTFSDYLMTLVNPACIVTFDMPPLNGYGLLEINSAIVYSAIDRMLGGTGSVPSTTRTFTDLEISIMNKFIAIMLSELRSAWSYILSIGFNMQEVQTNPAFVRIIPMREACLIVTLKIKVAETSGLVTVCIPYANLEPISSKLGNQQWHRYTAKQSDHIREAHQRNFNSVEVDVSAVLGQTEISMADLLNLQVGDVLSLESRTRDPISLLVAGDEKFKVRPGLLGKYKGVTIQRSVTKE